MTISLPQVPFPVDHRTRFIKQFDGPDEDSNIVCFRFWELVFAWGCPFRCAYCFLQTNPHVRFRGDALTGLLYGNWRRMLDEVELWLTSRTPRVLMVGELQDGLAFDSAYAQMSGKPLTHHLIPLFAEQSRHRLVILTKSTLIKYAMELIPTPQVVFSWSVNAEYASKRWELGTPSPKARFDAARRMKEAGWPIRIRLDPMIPYQDGEERWRDGYARALDQINRIGPEMVTIGALRATSKNALRRAAEQNDRPTDLFDYLTEKDPSDFKYRLPFDVQVEMYRFALERLDRARIAPALCKEDVSLWKALGLTFNGCHCLLGDRAPAAELVSSEAYVDLLSHMNVDGARVDVPESQTQPHGQAAATQLKLEANPGTYALVFSCPRKTVVQIGRLGEIRLRKGWYVYVGSALKAKTGVLRRVARHADLARPKKWNVDFAKPHLRLLEIWFTDDPARRECSWSATVGSLPGAEVHLKKFGGRDCRAGCPAHFYYFAGRPNLARFRESLVRRLPDHGSVGYLQAANPKGLVAQLAKLVKEVEASRIRGGRKTVRKVNS